MSKSNSMKSQFMNKSQLINKNNISLAHRFMKLNLFISLLQDNIRKKAPKMSQSPIRPAWNKSIKAPVVVEKPRFSPRK